MADIVGGFGVPHTPIFPFFVERDGPGCETAQLFAKLREQLEAVRPDLIVIFDTDHLNTFFLDNLPIFAVGVTDEFSGPNDEVRSLPVHRIKSSAAFAGHLRRAGVQAGFDLALAQEFSVDHSIAVPLHFLTDWNIPVVPVFISGHVPPLPSAQRCFDLGRTVKQAIESWPEPLRVAVLGSGSFSLEVWGPRIAPGRSDGVPDPDWVTRVCGYLEQARFDDLIAASTEPQMLRAGNVGGEILNWIAMLGTIAPKRPDFLAKQMQNGHAYAAWRT
jgi:hypothetical protein